MKKVVMILVAVFFLSIGANVSAGVNQRGVVWRGTHKVCGGGAELTLYQTGAMIFWYEGKKNTGRYNINDGYLNLFDENGDNIYSFKYSYDNSTQTLHWVDFNGTKLTKRNCQ